MSKKWIKKTVKIEKPTQKPVGHEFIGNFKGFRDRLIVDQDTGEEKTIQDIILYNDTDGKYAVPVDAGLNVAIKDADIVQEQEIKIVKEEQVNLKNGNKCNQYSIYISE